MNIVLLLLATMLSWSPGQSIEKKVAIRDIEFGLDQVESQCADLIRLKKIEWDKVSRDLRKQAKKIKSDADYVRCLQLLVARLQDGHARVRYLEDGEKLFFPEEYSVVTYGPGMFWTRCDGDIYVKNAFSTAAAAGVQAGSRILKVDGVPVEKWLEERAATLADRWSFSTEQHRWYFTCHQGLAEASGSRMKLELVDPGGAKKKRTISYARASKRPFGPVAPPGELEHTESLGYGKTSQGFGYIHVRDCDQDLPDQLDFVLPSMVEAPGLILDFRGNGGGGFDHDAFLGRFVAPDKLLSFARTVKSQGAVTYAGPIVVIIDATVKSAGETGSGMFKEEGRAYMIGESRTAGMASQKVTIELPSKIAALYVSVASNKAWFNSGKGIEGVGVEPHELVEFDPEDLAAGIDTLIVRAEDILSKGNPKKIPYDPSKFGWRAPAK